jgi:hypothetical protein
MATRRSVNRSRAAAAIAGLIVSLFRPGLTGPDARALAEKERVTRQLVLKNGARVTLQTSRGDVSIQGWDREVVDLKAEKTGDSADDMALVPVDIRASDDELAITSRVPAYAPNLRVRVDYQLRVPSRIDLKLLRTGWGNVTIAGVTGRAILQVDNGTVSISRFAGPLDVTTINGDIDARLTGIGEADFVKLETYNGDIRLSVPGAVTPHLDVRTLNGAIHSDIPLTVRNTFGPQVAHEANGVEEPLIRLISVSGDIHVTRH